MPTRRIINAESGTIVAELDYNAQDIITMLRVINNSNKSCALALVQRDANGNEVRRYGQTFPIGTSEVPIPTGAGQRLTQVFDSTRNRWDRVDVEFTAWV